MMDKEKQQALFEVQLFLPYEIKADKLKRDVTVSLPASEEQLEQVRESIGAASLAQYRLIQVASPIQGLGDYLPPGYDLKGLKNRISSSSFVGWLIGRSFRQTRPWPVCTTPSAFIRYFPKPSKSTNGSSA